MARPFLKFTNQQIEQVKTLAGYGLTNDQVATVMGIAKNTLYNNDELLAAIKTGQAIAATQLHKTAYEIAVKDRNPAMCMFILKCRHGWREKDQELDAAVKATLLSTIPIEKVQALLEERREENEARQRRSTVIDVE